ncbi:hypothetical protein Sjap_016886 [Stephania japonica]|uniref:Uncharacterized protein n=1 Tax=Stephania japonica TaxID=461633 RepID=A0AAP0I571_9MAGN
MVATDAALEKFKLRWELFKVACDQAKEFVESVKQCIGSEYLVDEATGSVAGRPGQTATTGLPPINAVRLEQMSKVVRLHVIELQQGSGTDGSASHAHPSVPFNARFPEDSGKVGLRGKKILETLWYRLVLHRILPVIKRSFSRIDSRNKLQKNTRKIKMETDQEHVQVQNKSNAHGRMDGRMGTNEWRMRLVCESVQQSDMKLGCAVGGLSRLVRTRGVDALLNNTVGRYVAGAGNDRWCRRIALACARAEESHASERRLAEIDHHGLKCTIRTCTHGQRSRTNRRLMCHCTRESVELIMD